MAMQDIVITFDDLPVGTEVTNQYYDKGVDFFGPPGGGLLPVIVQVPSGEAHSGNQKELLLPLNLIQQMLTAQLSPLQPRLMLH